MYTVTFMDHADRVKCNGDAYTITSTPRTVATLREAEDLVCREMANQLDETAILSIASAGGSKKLRNYEWMCKTATKEGWFKGRYIPLIFTWKIERLEAESVQLNDGWEEKFWENSWTEIVNAKRQDARMVALAMMTTTSLRA